MRAIELKFAAVIIFCVGIFVSAAASAGEPQPNWDGTWIGNWAGGHGTQIIFADDELIGVYWDDDYLEDTQSALSKDGLVVTITWGAGQVVLTRDSMKSAHVVFHEKGKPEVSFAVKHEE